jgi:hypothetical protein
MAEDVAKPAVPGWFWAAAIVALLWELAGCYAYLTQISMDAADLAKLPAGQAEMWRTMPIWAKCAYAVAVWVGLTGAIALLMRRRWAREAFAVSLLAVLVQFGWAFLGTPMLRTLGLSAAGFPILIILAAAVLFWFAGWATRRGWLR